MAFITFGLNPRSINFVIYPACFAALKFAVYNTARQSEYYQFINTVLFNLFGIKVNSGNAFRLFNLDLYN